MLALAHAQSLYLYPVHTGTCTVSSASSSIGIAGETIH